MKKILCIILLVGTSCYGQSEKLPLNQRLNQNGTEVKLNAFALAFGALDLEIERTLSKRSSVGLGIFTNLQKPGVEAGYSYQTQITGFYRYYFGKRYNQGFFLEAFGSYHVEERSAGVFFLGLNEPLIDYEYDDDFSLGAGLGYKWVSEKGLILQTNFGIGRGLFNYEDSDDLFGRFGVSIGYRF